MNISTMLSMLKVIKEVMKLLNDIESCILASSRLAIGLCSVHTINAAINASPVNEYSSIKLHIC